MVCKVKVTYHNREIIMEEKVHIDFRFLHEKFGIVLSKDLSRNPLVLFIQIKNNQEIWVSKNSFTTTVYIKFGERDVWKSLLVSDSFELDSRAFVKIDKYELKLEKIQTQNDLFTTPQTTGNSSQFNNWNNMNNLTNAPLRAHNKNVINPSQSYQTPLKPKNLENPFEQGITIASLDDESDELWDLIDDLLQNGNKQNDQKQSPKKADLMIEPRQPRKPQMCVLDSDEEEMIEALLTQKKSTSKRNSQGFNETENQHKRNQSPMSIEIQPESNNNIDASTRASDLIEIEPEISEKKSNNNSQQKIGPSSQTVERIEIEENKTSVQFSSPNIQVSFVEKQEILQPLTFSQQSQSGRSNRDLSNNKEKGESPALSKEKQLEIIQLIEDKRNSISAKNSVVKCPASQQKIIQESNECRICLSDIENLAKINSCTHLFCFTCINDWAKITNQCPLCKGRFEEITRHSNDGTVLETVQTAFKQQVYEDEGMYDLDTDENCYECETGEDPDSLLICDDCGFYCCHTYCCSPPLEAVPVEDWFCKFCLERRQTQRRTNGRSTANSRRNGQRNVNENSRGTSRRRREQTNLDDFVSISDNTQRRRQGQTNLDDFAFVGHTQRRSNRGNMEEEGSRNRSNNGRSRNRRNNGDNFVVMEELDIRLPGRTQRNQRRLVV